MSQLESLLLKDLYRTQVTMGMLGTIQQIEEGGLLAFTMVR